MSTTKLEWTDLDKRAVDTVRALAMDAVQKVGNGHPGTAMSLAPAAYLLFQRYLNHDPTDPAWTGRDRFVLSCGHTQPHALHPALPLRLRARARRPQVAAHLGLPHPGPPGARPHRRCRDDHGPARAGCRQRRRHGDGGPPGARPARPRRPRGREPVRPPRVLHRLRRRHRGGHQRRGVLAGRHPAARQPHPHLRPQPHLHRGRHEHRVVRGRGRALRGVRLARPGGRLALGQRQLPRGRRRPGPRAGRGAETSPTGRRSSRCAPSSRGPRRTRRTPARRTAAPSAPTRSPPPRRSSAWTPAKTFDVDPEVLAHAREVVDRGRAAHAEWDERFAAWAAKNTERQGAARPAAHPHPARRLDLGAARVPGRREGHGHPQGVRQGAGEDRAGAARALGRLGRPRRVQQHDSRGRAVVPPGGPPVEGCSPAARSAGCCTSASASTRWARS